MPVERIDRVVVGGGAGRNRHARAFTGFRVETSAGAIEADNVVAATGPFQCPIVPDMVPAVRSLLDPLSGGVTVSPAPENQI